MSGSLFALSLWMLTAAPARPSTAPAPRRDPKVLETLISCEGQEVFTQDGHWYRLYRGAYVECSPALPPSV